LKQKQAAYYHYFGFGSGLHLIFAKDIMLCSSLAIKIYFNSDLAPSSNSSTTNVLAHLPLGQFSLQVRLPSYQVIARPKMRELKKLVFPLGARSELRQIQIKPESKNWLKI